MPDQVDRVREQWLRERPGLDPSGIATIGRLLRAAALIGDEPDWIAAERGLSRQEADVLLTLRRAGAPFRLERGMLAASLLLFPSAFESRIDALERRGLLRQHVGAPAEELELSETGRQLVDKLLPHSVAKRKQLLAPLRAGDREALDRLLTALIEPLEAR